MLPLYRCTPVPCLLSSMKYIKWQRRGTLSTPRRNRQILNLCDVCFKATFSSSSSFPPGPLSLSLHELGEEAAIALPAICAVPRRVGLEVDQRLERA